MSAHTPAPWSTDGDAYSGNLDVISPTGRIAMLDCEFSEEPESVLEANARLIAAAPELLAALQNIVACFDANDPDSMANAAVDARAAIAKATGGAP